MASTSTTDSITSVIKPHYTEHTVSHHLLVDDKYWKLRLGKAENDESYFSIINKNCIVSRTFSAEDDGEVFWKIRVERDEFDKSKFKLYVDMESKPNNINVLLFLCLALRPTCSKQNKRSSTLRSEYRALITTPCKRGCYSPAILDEGFDKLRVDLGYAKVEKFDDPGFLISQPKEMKFSQKRSIASDIATLLDNRDASDVTLKANGRKWYLHKLILTARSSVFAAMFSSDMRENNEGVVEIQDTDSEALDLMIKFIYNDSIDDKKMQSAAEDLIFLADKYDITSLKENCEGCLVSLITADNCLRLFLTADKLNAQLLRTSAMKEISRNLLNFYEAEEYREFARNNFELSIEISRYALQNTATS